MKRNAYIITFLALAAFAAGCKPSEEASTSQRLDEATAETKAAAQEMKDYTFAQKAEFVTDMETRLEALNKELDQLAARIESSTDATKAEAAPRIQALRDQTAELTRQLDSVRNATESTWDSVKAAAHKAMDSAEDGFQQSRQWLSDKIAP